MRYRRPTEADYSAMVAAIDEWWGDGRQVDQLPRLWLRHFTGTSWLADDAAGRLVGFLVGFMSPDEPATAVCHLIGVAPGQRRCGIGRALYSRFQSDGVAAGAERIVAVVWPGSRVAVNFHLGLGFEADSGPGTQRLYGAAAYPNYDFGRVDRVVFVRPV